MAPKIYNSVLIAEICSCMFLLSGCSVMSAGMVMVANTTGKNVRGIETDRLHLVSVGTELRIHMQDQSTIEGGFRRITKSRGAAELVLSRDGGNVTVALNEIAHAEKLNGRRSVAAAFMTGLAVDLAIIYSLRKGLFSLP